MTAAAFVALATLLFKNHHLFVSLILEDLGSHRGTFNGGDSEGRLAIVHDKKDIFNLHLITLFGFGVAVNK